MPTESYRTEIIEDIDGMGYEYEFMEPTEGKLLALLTELFETHWSHIVFGPCIQGAVFEVRVPTAAKKISMLDGYLTVDFGDWHFHLCIGQHQGTKANPAPKALAQMRRASKAVFFRSLGRVCAGGSWGFRMWNGVDEQMLTVFFPNPYLDERFKPQKPDWTKLKLWNDMRMKYLPGSTAWIPDASVYAMQPDS
ncbi:MAG TPA: hypothetical protein VN666_15085 [Nitrospira sp.]|nr:hypothetical protein [Nitrospira sp.]